MANDFTAFLGAGTEYQGQLNFTGTVRIECRFTGNINSDGKLILGKGAHMEGTIAVKELVVHGTLNGEAVVTNRTILHKDARVAGKLHTPALVMEEGAVLQGELHMSAEAAPPSPYLEKNPDMSAQSEHSVAIMDASLKQ